MSHYYDLIKKVDSLDIFDKLKIYINYRIMMKALNLNRTVFIYTTYTCNSNLKVKDTTITYGEKDKGFYIFTFEEFISKEKNITYTFYNETGWQIIFTGIYEYYKKFNNKRFNF